MRASIDFLQNEISRISAQHGRLRTNCFQPLPCDVDFNVAVGESALAFSFDDSGVERVYYFAHDEEGLSLVLSDFESGSLVEVVSRDREEGKAALVKAGYRHYATFVRIACPDLKEHLYESIPQSLLALTEEGVGRTAKVEDASRVLDVLHATFDENTSHIPSKVDMVAQIEQGSVRLCEDDKGISSLLMFRIEGKKFYINQIFNRESKEIIHSILLTCLQNAMQIGINYAYAWVDEANTRSLAFHARYGIKPDGLYSISYMRE